MRFAFFLFLTAAALSAQLSLQAPPEPAALLKQYVHLRDDDLEKVNAGRVVVKRLETHGGGEVAIFGIARIGVPLDFFLAKYRDITTFKKDPAVLQIGKFSDPPRASDLDSLKLPPEEVEALKSCVAGNCKVKLSEQMIGRFRKEVDWNSPDSAAQAARLMHSMLVDYVNAYLASGNAAMILYDDKKSPAQLDEEFHGLLKGSPYLQEYAPAFYDYLAQNPRDKISGVETFLYWSQEKLGPLKPVLTVTQVSIYRRSSRGRDWCFIASKQIYASHYFDGSLGLAILTGEHAQTANPAIWMMYFNRSRVDGFTGLLGGLKRALAVSRALSGMEQNIDAIRKRLQAKFQGMRG